ncbi:MAG: HAMP domain-containing sensor histidine kinase [Pirellulales bacterium]
MRRPLRYQIMLPMAGIMLLAVVVVATLGAMLAIRATEDRIASQLFSVTQILEESSFPLTNSVLRQMRALSGAEYVLVGRTGGVLATSGSAKRFIEHVSNQGAPKSAHVTMGNRQWKRNGGYFHAVVPVAERRGASSSATLHLFYPEEDYRRAWQRAVYPSLAFAALALPVVMLVSSVTARRISGRMSRLQDQVEQIARGDFQQLSLGESDDEIRALGQSVNRMAAMLTQYEEEVRRTERMRTLALLGGGIAHQLRNWATGCNLALDLHSVECVTGATCESLSVAKQQLRLMEEYLQRFLQLGKPAERPLLEPVNLAKLIDELLPLLQPAARHAGVELRWDEGPSKNANVINGNAQLLSLLVINLLANAIEAASQGRVQTNTAGRVTIELARRSPERLELSVSDSGPGPSADVRDNLFEPFVTGHPDGVGIGLAVARDVVIRHGGDIRWRRTKNVTRFEVELPLSASGDAACLAS